MKHLTTGSVNVAIVAVLKNEGHILVEWLRHYLYHGIERFYLIDNDSNDDPKSIAKEFDSRIKWFAVSGNGTQQKSYDYVFPQVNAKWALIVDLDEFVYSPDGYSIPQTLEAFKTESGVGIPWVMFGSAGFYYQPDNVVQNFTWRYAPNEPRRQLIKMAVQMEHCSRFGTHLHDLKKAPVLSNSEPVTGSGFAYIHNDKLPEYTLLANHYAIQSWEYFSKVKMTRGDSARDDGKNIRDAAYFNSYDYHDIEDTRLARINAYAPCSLQRF